MNNYLGELFAVGTAILWSITSTFFTIGGKRVGSVVLNRIRLVIAVVFLSVTHLIFYGSFFPIHAEPSQWFWLGLSGIVGLVLGDTFLFQAFVLVGTHLSMLLMSLVPIISSLIAWFFLHEELSIVKLCAIMLTIGGIILVVLSKKNSNVNKNRKHFIIGILCGLAGAFGQALGLVIAKKGLGSDFSGLSATIIRVSIAMCVIWLYTIVTRKAKYTIQKLSNKKATLAITAGAFAGPFLGIWFSMLAIKWTYIGIASTLMALPPVILLPISYWIFKEKITIQSIIGTLLAISGSALIFLT